jgi:hypothetical protein
MNEIDRFLEAPWLPRVLTQEQAEFLQRGVSIENRRQELQLPICHTLPCGCSVEVEWIFTNADAHPTGVRAVRWDRFDGYKNDFPRFSEFEARKPVRVYCSHSPEYMEKTANDVAARLWDKYQRLFMGKTDS